ncbi:hypothetical protein DLAC_04496 [Tieghemostelium lacteum]|uniref:NADH dehydrogenase [ubiquinone] 1 beta subcomplex subunit 9 n=1 Tax=Tieghemostelium lacteum TaxID=361077 RepID=A0A151ZJM7_TIELA|nr:hypothetical protein DLAC_04496 [Tieghemostelium lacteum]|eukprot:KYQ94202.1 hypothetical protein DLAC_04496 [Tieghemostelium lacteum]
MRDYSEDYDIFLLNVRKLHDTVRENKYETSPFKIQQHMKDFERFVNYWEHPDPYIPCLLPGGSKYQRNTPPPAWVVDPRNHLVNID